MKWKSSTGCYYFGVVDCWLKYVPRDRVNRVAGASAGSLIAAYYLMELPLEPCLGAIIDMTEDIRRRTLGVFDRSNQIVDVLPKLLDRVFPEDAHKRVSGRLFISMTRMKDMKNFMVSEFETRQDLIDALNCSCFIPVWSGNHVSTYKGVKYLDGGFSDNMPIFDEHTIRICCFAGPSDIAPYDRKTYERLNYQILGTPIYLNFSNMRRFKRALVPPPPEFIISLLERGFHDAKQFILSNDLIQCQSCYEACRLDGDLPIYAQKFAPMLTPSGSPALSRSESWQENLDDESRGADTKKTEANPYLKANSKKNLRLSRGDLRSADSLLSLSEAHSVLSTSSSSGSSSRSGRRQPERADRDQNPQAGPASPGHDDEELDETNTQFGRLLREKLEREAKSEAELVEESESPGASDLASSFDNEVNCELSRLRAPSIVVEECVSGKQAHGSPEAAALVAAESAPENNHSELGETGTANNSTTRNNKKLGLRLNLNAINTQQSFDLSRSEDPVDRDAAAHMRNRARRPTLPANAPSEKFLQRRRNTLQSDLPVLQLPEKFRALAETLPSCPPSPNLDRHCTECIRLRQNARIDKLEETVRLEASKYAKKAIDKRRDQTTSLSSRSNSITQLNKYATKKLTRGLTSPIRWIRQMGAKRNPKNSYTFDFNEDSRIQEFHSDDEDLIEEEERLAASKARLCERRRASLAPGLQWSRNWNWNSNLNSNKTANWTKPRQTDEKCDKEQSFN